MASTMNASVNTAAQMSGDIALGASSTLQPTDEATTGIKQENVLSTQEYIDNDIEIEVMNSEGDILRRFPRKQPSHSKNMPQGDPKAASTSTPVKTGPPGSGASGYSNGTV